MRKGEPLDLSAGRPGMDVTIAANALMRLLLQPPTPAAGVVLRLHLIGARITGAVRLRHATVDVPVALQGCTFDEPVELDGAAVHSVDLTGSLVPAMIGDGLHVKGDLILRRIITDRLSLFRAAVDGDMWLNEAEINGRMECPQLTVKGGIYANSMKASGRANLWGARAFTLELDNASLGSADSTALRATGLQLEQNLECSNLTVTDGGIDLFGAKIGGRINLDDADLRNARGWAVHAPMLTVSGNVHGRRLAVDGGIDLAGATIGASVELPGARLVGRGRPAISAPAARTGSRFALDQAYVGGAVVMTHADVKGTLSFARATFGPASTVDVRNAVIGTLDMTGLHQPPAALDMRTAAIAAINDEPQTWAAQIELAMCTYQALHPFLPAKERLAWIRRTDDRYHPQPYEALAAYYRRLGHDYDARTTSLARHRQQRRSLLPPARLWGVIEDICTGYGYRTSRAFGWLAALTMSTAAVFAVHRPQPAAPGGPPFQPIIYALDLILPILDLRQERAYIPAGATQWVAWASTLAGWLLATAAIAGVTRRLSRS